MDMTLSCIDCDIVFNSTEELINHECEAHRRRPSMYCEHVREFSSMYAKAKGELLPDTPIKMSTDEINHLHSMVNDELEELSDAETIVDQGDALVDAIYYICDKAARHGINLDKLFWTVHVANMSKGGPNGNVQLDDKGKILKPDDFEPPNLENAIADQKARGSWV